MKKLVVAAVTVVLMSTGLVVASGGTASAQCSPSQYAGCFKTQTKVTTTKKVPKGSRATICVEVRVLGSNATPNGEVLIAVQKRRSSKVSKRKVDYFGGKMCVVTRKFTKKARYSVTAAYLSPSGSVFSNSSGKGHFKVTSRKK